MARDVITHGIEQHLLTTPDMCAAARAVLSLGINAPD
jgi:hypothetical protein